MSAEDRSPGQMLCASSGRAQALKPARTASTDEERLAACQQTVSCYRGPLCDGAGYDWTEPHAENARLRALDAWTRIAGIVQDTDPEQALAALETALTY